MTSQVFRAMIPPPITIQPVQLWGFRGMPPDIAQVDGGWAGIDARDGQSNEPFAKVAHDRIHIAALIAVPYTPEVEQYL